MFIIIFILFPHSLITVLLGIINVSDSTLSSVIALEIGTCIGIVVLYRCESSLCRVGTTHRFINVLIYLQVHDSFNIHPERTIRRGMDTLGFALKNIGPRQDPPEPLTSWQSPETSSKNLPCRYPDRARAKPVNHPSPRTPYSPWQVCVHRHP